MNNKLQQDDRFVEAVDTCARASFSSASVTNFIRKWELFKQPVKQKSLERSSATNNDEKNTEATLRSNLDARI